MSAIEQTYNVHKVASLLAIDERTVWRRVAEGKLRKPVKDGRASRWHESDLAEYQQRLRDERGE
jgi:predicted DNA-binding transcriptional regulator AlpA